MVHPNTVTLSDLGFDATGKKKLAVGLSGDDGEVVIAVGFGEGEIRRLVGALTHWLLNGELMTQEELDGSGPEVRGSS